METPINLDNIQKAMQTMDSLVPSKESACSYMKMSTSTWYRLLNRIRPYEYETDDLSSEQIIALEFIGVKVYTDDTIQDNIVRSFNVDGEVVQEFNIGGGQ